MVPQQNENLLSISLACLFRAIHCSQGSFGCSCQEKKLMVELGICVRNPFVYKRWTKPSCTESSRNPTAEANFFAYSFQTPFSQLADQNHSQRSFELVYPQCWVKLHLVFFYCLLFDFFPSFCYSPFKNTQVFTLLSSSLHHIIPLDMCFHFVKDTWLCRGISLLSICSFNNQKWRGLLKHPHSKRFNSNQANIMND